MLHPRTPLSARFHLLTTASLLLIFSCIASAQSAFVRVNQVGYTSGG